MSRHTIWYAWYMTYPFVGTSGFYIMRTTLSNRKIFLRYFFQVLASSTGFIFLSSLGVHAQGNLLVTPMRMIFEGREKMQELSLANTGSDTARYLISFIEIRMNENGTSEKINQPDSGQKFASPFIRFFPRSVVLPPNDAQLIKLQLINTSQLDSGEYRSHLYLRAELQKTPLGEEPETEQKDSGNLSVKLTPVFGLSIPIIIRVGTQTGTVDIADLSIDKYNGAPLLNIEFERQGNTSVYGDVKVEYVSAQGKATQVGLVRGVAVYTPNRSRHLQIPLIQKAGINYSSGKLVVDYSITIQGKSKTFAKRELQLK